MHRLANLLLISVAGVGLSGIGAGPAVGAGGDAALAVAETIAVERALIEEDRESHRRLLARRVQLEARLGDLYLSLEQLLADGAELSPEELVELTRQIDDTERDRSQVLAQQRALLEQVKERVRRIRALEERLGIIREKEREDAGPLEGSWEVVFLPAEQRGVLQLRQTGTLVTGTYELEGGWSGSLQGTLVNRKVYLIRIDSQLGRSMEMEGVLSVEGDRIRGSWLNYDLSAEGGAEGQWTASRTE